MPYGSKPETFAAGARAAEAHETDRHTVMAPRLARGSGSALLLYPGSVGYGVLHRALDLWLLRPVELALLLLFLLALSGEFLLPLFESVVTLWQEYSE